MLWFICLIMNLLATEILLKCPHSLSSGTQRKAFPCDIPLRAAFHFHFLVIQKICRHSAFSRLFLTSLQFSWQLYQRGLLLPFSNMASPLMNVETAFLHSWRIGLNDPRLQDLEVPLIPLIISGKRDYKHTVDTIFPIGVD